MLPEILDVHINCLLTNMQQQFAYNPHALPVSAICRHISYSILLSLQQLCSVSGVFSSHMLLSMLSTHAALPMQRSSPCVCNVPCCSMHVAAVVYMLLLILSTHAASSDAQPHKLNIVLLQPSCSVSSADDPHAAFDAEHLFSIIIANAQHNKLTTFLLQHACNMSSADDHDLDALVVTAAAFMQRQWCRKPTCCSQR